MAVLPNTHLGFPLSHYVLFVCGQGTLLSWLIELLQISSAEAEPFFFFSKAIIGRSLCLFLSGEDILEQTFYLFRILTAFHVLIIQLCYYRKHYKLVLIYSYTYSTLDM